MSHYIPVPKPFHKQPDPVVKGAWDVLVSAGAEVTEDTLYDTAQGAHVRRVAIRVGYLFRAYIPSQVISEEQARDEAAWLLIQELVQR